MAKRKEELTTEDAPDSIAPWQMLEDEEIEDLSARIRAKLEGRNLTAFARRDDNGHIACFDRGDDGKGKTVIVLDRYTGETARQFDGFTGWFDSATSTKSR